MNRGGIATGTLTIFERRFAHRHDRSATPTNIRNGFVKAGESVTSIHINNAGTSWSEYPALNVFQAMTRNYCDEEMDRQGIKPQEKPKRTKKSQP